MSEELKKTETTKQPTAQGVGVHTMVMPIYDLIYCNIRKAKELLTIYPNAKISDASDLVHENRFDIRLKDTEKNYFKNLVKTGLALVSLSFKLATMEKDKHPLIREVIKELETA